MNYSLIVRYVYIVGTLFVRPINYNYLVNLVLFIQQTDLFMLFEICKKKIFYFMFYGSLKSELLFVNLLSKCFFFNCYKYILSLFMFAIIFAEY